MPIPGESGKITQ